MPPIRSRYLQSLKLEFCSTSALIVAKTVMITTELMKKNIRERKTKSYKPKPNIQAVVTVRHIKKIWRSGFISNVSRKRLFFSSLHFSQSLFEERHQQKVQSN